MRVFVRESHFNAPVDSLRDFHFASGAFEKLSPPWEKAELVSEAHPLCDGARASIRIRIGPFSRIWIAEHQLHEDGFTDRQIEGPFKSWEHRHIFTSTGENSCCLTDSIRYQLPGGVLGHIFGKPIVERKLDRMFRYRHDITRKALEGQS